MSEEKKKMISSDLQMRLCNHIARGDKTDDKNSTAEAGKPYKLVANQKIYIFETRDAAENFITGGENEKLAIIDTDALKRRVFIPVEKIKEVIKNI